MSKVRFMKKRIVSCLLYFIIITAALLLGMRTTALAEQPTITLGYVSMFEEDTIESKVERYNLMSLADAVENCGIYKCKIIEFKNADDIIQALTTGEVDIIMPMEISNNTKENGHNGRKVGSLEDMPVPDIVGLYAAVGDSRFSAADLNTMNNIRVGTWNDRVINLSMDKFIRENSMNWDVHYFSNRQECTDALQNGKVEIMIDSTSGANISLEQLVLRIDLIDSSMVYYADNPKIGTFNEMLKSTNFSSYKSLLYVNNANLMSLISKEISYYTRGEQNYIKSLKPVRVAMYKDNPNAPVKYYSADGTGIFTDIINSIRSDMGMSFEIVEVKDSEDAFKALEDGRADLAIDIYNRNNERSKIVVSRPIIQEKYVFISKYETDENKFRSLIEHSGGKIGIVGDYKLVIDYLKDHVGLNEITSFDTIDDLYDAIAKGKIDSGLVHEREAHAFDLASNYPTVVIAPVDGIDVPISFLGGPKTQEMLVRVLNKSLVRLGKLNTEQIVMNNIREANWFDLAVVYKRYPVQVWMGIAVVLLLIVVQILFHYNHKLLMNKNKKLEETMEDLNRANVDLNNMNKELNKTNAELSAVNKELKETSEALEEANKELKRTSESLNEANFEKNNYKFVSETDKLTGILNKSAVETACQNLIYENAHGALFIIDLDYFKEVNDNLGHQVGDQILTMFAIKLSSCLRNADIVGRFGGDEFVVYTKGENDREILSNLAIRINDVARGLNTGDDNIKVSASIGISLFPECGEDYDTLFKQADRSVYLVKQAGRDGYHIYEKGE